jgi:NAD(P)H-hydrate repair Nnr-like enzyme with NAD(P)H-hydrate dehydratase domain
MNFIYVDQKKYQNATDLLTKTHKGIQGHALIIAGSYGKIELQFWHQRAV